MGEPEFWASEHHTSRMKHEKTGDPHLGYTFRPPNGVQNVSPDSRGTLFEPQIGGRKMYPKRGSPPRSILTFTAQHFRMKKIPTCTSLPPPKHTSLPKLHSEPQPAYTQTSADTQNNILVPPPTDYPPAHMNSHECIGDTFGLSPTCTPCEIYVVPAECSEPVAHAGPPSSRTTRCGIRCRMNRNNVHSAQRC